MFDEFGDLLTVEGVCEVLGIGRNMVYRLFNSGEIKALRRGSAWKILVKIPKEAIEQYIRLWSRL